VVAGFLQVLCFAASTWADAKNQDPTIRLASPGVRTNTRLPFTLQHLGISTSYRPLRVAALQILKPESE